MGLAQAIRAVIGQISGAHDDYDDYHDDGDYDEIYRDESRRHSPRARERAAGSLALVRPPRIEFSLVRPQGFDDAQQISARLRADSPVIVDLQSCGRDLSERLIDFCSGLTYALEGSLEYVGEKVVLLAPHNVELSREASGGLHERRFFNQA